jgi:3-hydroxyisobutyrate dehydrogenase-like beta-hydroxyacid dehydrogenase
MANVAFLGTGLMGGPMARRLLDAGHDVTVWNRTAERARPLAEAGAEVAGTPAEAASGAEFVITMLANQNALREVVTGPRGVASGIRPDSVLIDMSTVGPDEVRRLRQELPPEVELVDAPVMGSVGRATAGELTIVVGAAEPVFERVKDLLEVLGKPRHVGDLGAGAAMKLVLNSTLGAMVAAVGEAIALADGLGLDRKIVLDVLEASQVGAFVQQKRDAIQSGDYPPQFKLSLAAKDLRLVEEAAKRAGIDLEVASLTRTMLERAEKEGRGDQDYAALVGSILERAESS